MDDAGDPPAIPAEEEDADESDEVADFRLLQILTSPAHHPTIPRRGEKDFEPHGTSTQQSLLDVSLQAMVDALSGLRVHLPKTHLAATYAWETGRAAVRKPKGPHFHTLGKGEEGGRIGLAQEELLYLLERGSLDARAGNGGAEIDAFPFSLQRAYSTLSELPLEGYTVYGALRRNGYVVARAPRSLRSVRGGKASAAANRLETSLQGGYGFGLGRWWSSASKRSETLLQPGLFRSIEVIQRVLSIVPFYDARQAMGDKTAAAQATDGATDPSETHLLTRSPLLQTLFHVWKPRPGFRKSAPGRPDFQMAVVGTNESSCPRLWELDQLLAATAPVNPDAEEDAGKNVFAKLRNRERNAVIAVVDQGVVSYVKVTDAQFGRERLHARHGRKGGGKGGSKRAGPDTST